MQNVCNAAGESVLLGRRGKTSYLVRVCRTQVYAVVTQPGRPKGRGRKSVESPVAQVARAHGIEDNRVLCPVTVRDVSCLPPVPYLCNANDEVVP